MVIVDELAYQMGQRLEELRTSREAHLAYLDVKTSAQDWHGVACTANSLREIDAELRTIHHFKKSSNR